jgi:hypothetical protein
VLLKFFAPSRSNDGAATLYDIRDGIPVGLNNVFGPIQHSLIAFVDEKHSAAEIETGSNNSSHSAVHAWRSK